MYKDYTFSIFLFSNITDNFKTLMLRSKSQPEFGFDFKFERYSSTVGMWNVLKSPHYVIMGHPVMKTGIKVAVGPSQLFYIGSSIETGIGYHISN